MAKKIVGISDVSLGFGSPQIGLFMKVMLEKYADSTGIVLEPDQPEKPYLRKRYQEFNIERIFTQSDVYSDLGRNEYIRKCVKIVNALQPDVLILFCSFTLPVLFKIKKRPNKVIYYNIEMASAYGRNDSVLNSNIRGKVDLLIYPESNRAMLDINKFGYQGIPSILVLNCTNLEKELENIILPEKRNGKILYSGRLDYINTSAQYFFSHYLEKYKIDIFGNIAGENSEALKGGFLQLNGKVRYMGYVENEKLKAIRKYYAYSIVMWNPVNENQYYAAPNKFFEAIADGVIPISAPHPQCKQIIEKYDCGILMEDWSFDSFINAIELSMRLYNTPRYVELVNNCKKAVLSELSWEKQMKKLEMVI